MDAADVVVVVEIGGREEAERVIGEARVRLGDLAGR
jgi:hypothetical protein